MDFITQCYYSRMRPYRDRPDISIPGRWRWCPPGATLIPYLHAFASFTMDYGEERIDPALGEVPRKNGRTRGESSPRYTGQHFCGSEDAWTNGILYAQALPQQVDIDGIPICCRAAPLLPGGVAWDGIVRIETGGGQDLDGGAELVETGDGQDVGGGNDPSAYEYPSGGGTEDGTTYTGDETGDGQDAGGGTEQVESGAGQDVGGGTVGLVIGEAAGGGQELAGGDVPAAASGGGQDQTGGTVVFLATGGGQDQGGGNALVVSGGGQDQGGGNVVVPTNGGQDLGGGNALVLTGGGQDAGGGNGLVLTGGGQDCGLNPNGDETGGGQDVGQIVTADEQGDGQETSGWNEQTCDTDICTPAFLPTPLTAFVVAISGACPVAGDHIIRWDRAAGPTSYDDGTSGPASPFTLGCVHPAGQWILGVSDGTFSTSRVLTPIGGASFSFVAEDFNGALGVWSGHFTVQIRTP